MPRALESLWSTIPEIHATLLALAVVLVVAVLWRRGRRRVAVDVLAIAALIPLMGTGPARDVQAEPHYFLVPLAAVVATASLVARARWGDRRG